jgi:hypothetical protein
MSEFWGVVRRLLRALVLSLLLACAGLAQEPASSPPQPSPPTTTQNPQKPDQNAESSDQDQIKSASEKPQPETKITPEQAEQLFHDVDTILDFASKDTSLPVKHQVKRRLVGRDEVVSYLKKNMAEDKDVRRLRRTELVLKKFGLLPKDFDLQTFLVGLLEEQVAGYYDAKTKTVNLLDWVVPDLQRPVLAHELTHALQDQSFGLDKWLKKGEEDLDTKKDLTPDDITRDENAEAREAVVEGQAMAVFVDYMLAPVHHSVADAPEFVRELSAGTADSPQFRKAPILLKQSLMFPYTYGVQFEAELLRSQGKEKAYLATFQNPPQTSREIMEPSTYISGEHLAPLPLPDFKHILRGYDRFDVGAVGEFDVAVLAEQYSSEEASRRIYSSWRGGYYYAARPKGNQAAALGLIFVSKWANAKIAAQFAAIYAQGMKQRYKSVEAPADPNLPADLKTLQSLSGDHAWKTEDGPIEIDVKGDTVLVTESLDSGISNLLRSAVLETAKAASQ